jgi:flagellar export protein FliJ
MRRFEFRLARVRDFRRQQLELEEAKLERINAERQELETETSRLDNETAQTRGSLMVTTAAEARELVAADLYLRHLAATRKRHEERIAAWQARVRRQQAAVIEARRRVRLMEKLEEHQFRDWTTETEREQENLSSELFLARWKQP